MMHTITIVALGPGSPDLLTLGALRQVKKARRVILRTARHCAAAFLREEGVAFESLDALYEESGDFDAFALRAVDCLLGIADKQALTYAVPDPNRDETVRLLLEQAGDSVRVLPGVALDTALAIQAGLRGPFLTACAVGLAVHNAQQPLCVVELDSRRLAGEVKLKIAGEIRGRG